MSASAGAGRLLCCQGGLEERRGRAAGICQAPSGGGLTLPGAVQADQPGPGCALASACTYMNLGDLNTMQPLHNTELVRPDSNEAKDVTLLVACFAGAAANALSLVEPQHAWLEDQAPAQPAGQAQQSLFGAVPQPSQPLSPSTQADSSHGYTLLAVCSVYLARRHSRSRNHPLVTVLQKEHLYLQIV